MKSLIQLCVLGSIVIVSSAAQPPLRKGVSVHMPTATHAVEMRAADDPNSTVVAITAEGKVYSGVDPTEPAALSSIAADTVYVKADARAPFQTVLAVLDALRGKSVVLLAASPAKSDSAKFVWPYGIKLTVAP